jgi:hypothetical protein
MSLTVLLTNHVLSGRTGTETQTRNLALALRAAGHRPIVYSTTHGPIVDELRRASIAVTDDINSITLPIDVIHGHHNSATAIAATRFQQTPCVFVCQDFAQWHDIPPKLPSIRAYLTTSPANCDRLTVECGIPPEKIELLLHAVDLTRCIPGPALPQTPRHAVLIAKGRDYVPAFATACRARGIAFAAIGRPVGNLIADPEAHVAQSDLVFASGLGAMEAIACGRAVIVCDPRGLGGFCSMDRYPDYRLNNFGLRVLTNPLTPDAIGREIDRYDADQATRVSDRFRLEGSFATHVRQLVDVYRRIIDEHRHTPIPPEDWHAALATHLQTWGPRGNPAWPWMVERDELLSQLDEQEKPLPAIGPGRPYGLSQNDDRNWCRLGGDLGRIEPFGIWTVGKVAWLRLRVDDPTRQRVRMTFNLRPFICPASQTRSVDVTANGHPVAEWRFEGENAAFIERELTLSGDQIDVDGSVWISFHIRNPEVPKDLGFNSDTRALGIQLNRLELAPA